MPLAASIALYATAIVAMVVLGWSSLYLAAMRIYQVDEACNVLTGFWLSTGQFVGACDIFQIILSRIIPNGGQSAELFSTARLLMVVIMWSNWILLACATGERVLSGRWLGALIAAATLAPLWDYGFEVRHDNLMLAVLLLTWTIVRFGPLRWQSMTLLGAATVALQFVAMKAFVYTFPIVFITLLLRSGKSGLALWKSVLSLLGGAAICYATVRFAFHLAGVGDYNASGIEGIASVPERSTRFWPWGITLSRLLAQTPLLLALVVAALVAFAFKIRCNGWEFLKWDGVFPEVLLFAVALVALHINPNPYPYNLLHLVPYAFLLAYRYATTCMDASMVLRKSFLPLVISVVCFSHLVPFAIATRRHLDWSNMRQEELIQLAERLTDPRHDPVFDGIGMVPTRPIVDPGAFIHGQSLGQLLKGDAPQIRDLLASNPPPVVIPNYRTEWLPDADQEFFRKHYVRVSDDFLLLGSILPPGGGQFTINKKGRYRISTVEDSDLTGTYPEGTAGNANLATSSPVVGTLNNTLITSVLVELSPGTHELKTASDSQVAIVWVGPRTDRVGRHGKGNRQTLFYNWY